jgi:transcriptional regulator with PAS, ATPase and Fis domain
MGANPFAEGESLDAWADAEVRQGVAVLICDGRRERRDRLVGMVTSVNRDVRVVAHASEAPATTLALAIMALDDGALALESLLSSIRGLRQRGVPILCYAAGSQTWPLARRCQFLLAGAPTLLDATEAEFEAHVAAALAARIGPAAEAQSAAARVRAAARALGIVGTSAAMRAALLAVDRSTQLTNMPVLLVGESGTGKDLLARAVHTLDPARREHPFVAVNCAALAKTLVEAELFGHRKGTYSGADRDRPGLVRAADRGVLFLDEIGELDLDVQAKLLRVIQERRVLTLGDTHETPVDLRIVAATHRDLRELARQERFRADLLNRLWVYPVDVPPLRDRREDIRPLVTFFVRKYGGASRTPLVGSDFVEALEQVTLGGNVRQLESLVQRAVAISDGQRPLGLAELPPELWTELANRGCSAATATDCEPRDLNLGRALARHEHVLVAAALRESGGNQARAASLLGITARSLYTKVRKHGLARRPPA